MAIEPNNARQPETAAATVHPLLKLAIELGPLLVFFVANTRGGIFWGTGAFMVATITSLIASRLLLGRIPVMPLVTAFFVLTFGGLTLYFQDEVFIKMKPTIVNGLFALILFGGLTFGVHLLKFVLEAAFDLEEEGWRILTIRWAIFFVFLAILNEFVWRLFSTETWVNFKVWGVMPITMVFAGLQLGLIKRYSRDTDQPRDAAR